MQLVDGAVLYSASDLVAAAECEFAAARRIEETLGLIPPRQDPADALMERAARLGDAHEARILAAKQDRYGPGVVQIPRPARGAVGLDEAQRATLSAVRDGAAVIAQAVLFDGRLLGYADFLLRQDDGRYAVADAKLARSAKVRAVLQIAAYHDLAAAAGIPVSEMGQLLLGDDTQTDHYLPHVVPVVRERREHLEALIAERSAAASALTWRDPAVFACGRCAACQAEVEASRDVLLVAGLRMTQRKRLADAGIRTIDELAAADFAPAAAEGAPVRPRPAGIAPTVLAGLQAQARLQLAQMADDTGEQGQDPAPPKVRYEVVDPTRLAAIPRPSPGDIFFDFEGDPLWRDSAGRFGLEYLFGVVEPPEAAGGAARFRDFQAHDRAQEKQALIDFIAYVKDRRSRWPDMHIYHYADYERAALLRLAALHGVCEDDVDDLLRGEVLVDLYPIVRRSVRVSQPSYSLKKLEPLYMGDELRTGDVTNAGDSVVAYATYCEARDDGRDQDAAALLADILDYNEYDCRSTLGLCDWLRERAGEHGIEPVQVEPSQDGVEDGATAGQESDLAQPLLDWANAGGHRRAVDDAVALVGAAVGYHRREDKPFWWAHYARLSADLDSLDDREAMVVRHARVVQDWHTPPRKRNPRRVLELTGELATGSDLERARECFLVYDPPYPEHLSGNGNPTDRGWGEAQIDRGAISTDADGNTVLRVAEVLPRKAAPFEDLPVMVGPGSGPRPGTVRDALREVATDLRGGMPSDPGQQALTEQALPTPARDLLLRRPPRLTGLARLPMALEGQFAPAITEAVLALDRSTISVQGPPGTGKTYVGSHVIAQLVQEHGWRVGVVAQSHPVVNNLLDKVVEAGVAADRVGKKNRPENAAWTDLKTPKYATFLAEHADTGCVIGGTAWDFTNENRVQRGELDLLVVDEAGQFSLATTLASSVAAQRMLLLGDPQQLHQVSAGTHPEPVDVSALGWLSDGLTLRPELGYFLDRSWRMHPELTARVSAHSYANRLHSKLPETTQRHMTDAGGATVQPGLHTVTVEHTGNATRSPEEAARIVDLVREALTWQWSPEAGASPRPMRRSDVLVVAPYNAQVALVRAELAAAGLPDVRVGTVDKFQGQEAPVAIVSMTASAPEDVPRGMDFLLSPNRVNVAVSRAQWRAVVVRSSALTDFLPTSPDGLAQLGRFLGLVA